MKKYLKKRKDNFWFLTQCEISIASKPYIPYMIKHAVKCILLYAYVKFFLKNL